MKKITIVGLLFLVLTGCAPKMYYWGTYEDDLYHYYKSPKSPEDQEIYILKLSSLIGRATETGAKIPPGIYAEYGYALFKAGKNQEAIEYFEKEKSLWPESKPLMDRMITNVHAMINTKSPVQEK